MSIDYHELAALRDIYLEDSWVLDIRIDARAVEFTIDFVLTETHPNYSPPKPNEQYCYRNGALRFENVRIVTWASRGAPPAVDATGATDLGHIEGFRFEGHDYVLDGDWGRMAISSASEPILSLS